MNKKLLLAVFSSVLLLLAPVAPVFGLSAADRGFLNTPFYDPNSTENLCGNGGNFTGSNNPEIVFNYFRSKGLSNEQAAGVVGNAMVESGQSIDPTIVSRSGYRGIFQWDASSRWPRLVSWAQGQKLDELALETQLQYSWEEATERGNIEGIKEQTEVDLAAWYWGRFFEVAIINGNTSATPLTNVQGLSDRIKYANLVFDEYATSESGTPATSSSVSCSGSLGKVECPANIEAHPSEAGYFKMPDAPNNEYLVYATESRRWGSRELVCALYSVALAYNEAMAGKSKLRIGNLNTPYKQPSVSHRWGTANDHSGFGELQAASHTESWKGTYSKEATVLLGKLWVDTGMLRNIWWCPPPGDTSIEEILAYADEKGGIEGQIKCQPGHADHFHVDIKLEFQLQVYSP